ncbi:MAG: non-heme iron oxygenase ferredoxin subunit [Armatimonadetes bacterium]|nr:non-heme iron oxygenase ferredoxin subunit [Armatimonadota bacterium]
MTVARVSDLAPGEARLVQAGGRAIALFRRDEGWYAIDNACPHRGGSLADGDVEGFVVTCPLHASQFDIRTGALISPPAQSPVRAYRVAVTGDDVQIDL